MQFLPDEKGIKECGWRCTECCGRNRSGMNDFTFGPHKSELSCRLIIGMRANTPFGMVLSPGRELFVVKI